MKEHRLFQIECEYAYYSILAFIMGWDKIIYCSLLPDSHSHSITHPYLPCGFFDEDNCVYKKGVVRI